MTFTFKLSRRLARLRVLPLVGAALITVGCGADSPSEPTGSPSFPSSSSGILITPDSAATKVDGAVQFGAEDTDSLSVETLAARWNWRKYYPGKLNVAPSTATVLAGSTRGFRATRSTFSAIVVTTSVRWTATGGTIDRVGRFKAGKLPGDFSVIATMANGVSDTAAVTVVGVESATASTIVLSPASINMTTGGSQQFTAVGQAADASPVAIVPTFSATGGTVASDGRYTAPLTAGTFQVIAQDSISGKADTSTVIVTSIAPVLADVVLTPGSASLDAGDKKQFAAAGKSADGASLAISPTYSATGGSISASGLYTAGSTAGTFKVIAKVGADFADTSSVTIAPAAPTLSSVVLTPVSASLASGGTMQFATKGVLSNGNDTSVTVTFTAAGGSITTNGLYSAGTSAGSYKVIAKVTGATLADTSTVTVSVPTPPTPPPPPPPTTPPSTAGVIFDDQFNDLSKWSTEKCCGYSVEAVASPAREGSSAARLELRRSDPSPEGVVNGSHRSELARPRLSGWSGDANGPFKSGDEVWYGFSVYIPSDWVNDPQAQEVLQQIHNTPDNKAGTSSPDWSVARSPFLALIGENGNFRWWVLTNPGKYGTSAWVEYPIQDYVYTGAMKKGGWTDWVIHAKWSYQSDGRLEIWRDGVKVVNRTGPNSYNEENPGFFKIGVYKWSWGNTAVTERIIGYDNLRIADSGGSYESVAPR